MTSLPIDLTGASTQGAPTSPTHSAQHNRIHQYINAVWNVKDSQFGALGNDSNDDTAEIQAAIDAAEAAGGGVVFFPPGTYRFTTLTVDGSANVELVGSSKRSILRSTSATGNWITINQQFCGLRNLMLDSPAATGGSGPTDGLAVVFGTSAYRCFVDDVSIRYSYNGIQNQGTETRLSRLEFRYLFGVHGLLNYRTTSGAYRIIIDDLNADNPYPGNAPTAAGEKAWATSTAYSLHDVVHVNSAIYQCTTAGTSAGAGTGPNNTTSFTAGITDGTVTWKFVSKELNWITMDSFTYSMVINKAALLNGYCGIVMRDTQNSGSSYPVWIFGHDVEIDHSFYDCVLLQAGEGVFFDSNCWFSSTLQNNGIELTSGFRGEFRVVNSRIYGCARHGILIDAEEDCQIESNFIGGNSQEAVATYNGITIGSNVDGFIIRGNKIGDLTAGTTQQAYGIFLNTGDDNYTITDNDLRGNDSGGLTGHTPSATKVVRNNRGYVTESQGTGTITTTSLTVNHGLSITPSLQHIHITWGENPTSNWGAWWISGITSTQFTVNVETDPGASDLDFGWQVLVW